ncbi:winged helix-turn-helix transcriptional regulator [Enterococcus sp. LJL90]
MKKIYHLAVEATLDVISGKWKPIILCHLGEGKLRNGELRRRMPMISQRILTKQLRELEADNLITRQEYEEIPPKVEYSLTTEGKSLREILILMSEWGETRVKQEKENGLEIEILNPKIDGFKNML